jgi:hypothetical protein
LVGGTALVWWERKIQDISKCVNLLSSWLEFKSTIRKKLYPLGYLHKERMEWKTLRQSKGQTIQSFTEEFRKKSLALNITLDSYETLMKYIGALHSYIRHALLLFNPLVLMKFVSNPLTLRTGERMFKKIPRRTLPISHISHLIILKGRTRRPPR